MTHVFHQGQWRKDSVIEAKVGEEIRLRKGHKDWLWVRWIPELREYDNLGGGHHRAPLGFFAPIVYHPIPLSQKAVIQLDTISAGTHCIGILPPNQLDSIISTHLPLSLFPHIHQLVLRTDDSYLGYISELFHTPFILPPKNIWSLGHQSDLRVGTDCAELAIYGRRRMGYDVPYLGPRGIYQFLEPINESELQAGDIIHFGFQVCVFYQHSHQPNQFNPEDLLIQSYENTVYISSFQESGFFGKGYRCFRWKE